MKTPTVAEIIKKLEKMPQNAPCFIRSKYTGATEPFESYPVNLHGISETHGVQANGYPEIKVEFLF